MPKGDHCAVYGCNNDRRFPEKYVVKEHTSFFGGKPHIRFWCCTEPRKYALWSRLLNRKNFKVGKHTKVCSNHFKFGKPVEHDPNPTLFLKGYDCKYDDKPLKRKAPAERLPLLTKKKKRKNTGNTTSVSNSNTAVIQESDTNIQPDSVHNDDTNAVLTGTAINVPDFESSTETQNENCKFKTTATQTESPEFVATETQTNKLPEFDINKIKHSDKLMKLYTGCPNYKVFLFIFNKVQCKVGKLHFHRGKVTASNVNKPKNYQNSPSKPGCRVKSGPTCELTPENQMLAALMKIRLDLHIDDLAFRFGISSMPRIVTTWIEFLGRELVSLIYWPTVEETLSYNPPCFIDDLKKVEGIIDCTEQHIEKPSNAKLQYQTYSTYKSANTLKKLIVCTKAGSISYISDAYGGLASDRYITEDCNVVRKFNRGMVALVDRGFTVQDVFLQHRVTVASPPFTAGKKQFTKDQVERAKIIARARIHVERAIGRMKEFQMLKNELPLNMLDLADYIWIIAGAICNLQPPLVKVP